MLIPAESWAASPSVSLRVGCGWILVPTSQADASRKRASAASETSSDACCKQHPADGIADGIDVCLRRAVSLVHLDPALLHAHTRFLQAQICRHSAAPDGHQRLVHLDLLLCAFVVHCQLHHAIVSLALIC